MLSMAFKLVENNLSPTQRSRSQVKEKQAFFKRLERSLLVNAATLFKIQTYTNNLLWQCSHSFTLQQFTRKRIASEKRSATCTSSPTYQLSVTSSSNTQQRNRSTLFIRQVWSQLHIQNAASIWRKENSSQRLIFFNITTSIHQSRIHTQHTLFLHMHNSYNMSYHTLFKYMKIFVKFPLNL